MPLMLLGTMGWPEILGIGLLAVIIFGGKKLPQLGAGLGQGIRNFKESLSGKDKQLDEPNEEHSKS